MPRKMLLWIDTESTGLLEHKPQPTILEASWTITDAEGDQRTGLSQAFCALRIGGGMPHVPSLGWDNETPVGYWDAPNNSYPHEKVREMHEVSGLSAEWALANETDPDRIITGWGELERLILDDLRDAGVRSLGKHELALAGAGVGHYEHKFLPALMPRVFGDERMHYRPHDVSVILSGLRNRLHLAFPDFPGKADRLIEAIRTRAPGPYEWAPVAISPSRFDADDSNRGDQRWAEMDQGPHRAAPDVARALMAHRLLPEIARLLTPAPV